MNKLIQDYLIRYDMEITPDIINKINKIYKIISARDIEYELLDENLPLYNKRLYELSCVENVIEDYTKTIESLRSLLKYDYLVVVKVWLFFDKIIDRTNDINELIDKYTETINLKLKMKTELEEKISDIRLKNKIELDVRNAVLMAKSNVWNDEFKPEVLLG